MPVRVPVNPELLRWACQRADLTVDALLSRFPRLEAWLAGEAQPTLKQLESFAKATRAPIGYFFLPEPPIETVPIPDFRTVGNERIDRPSPDLLDTLYICQQRQDWYREYARTAGEPELAFVGSASRTERPADVADRIREALGFSVEDRRDQGTWTEALRLFIEEAETTGVLTMVSGVVGSNNSRRLNPDEFRGFALADPRAPLVFINGADTKAAQMFTLAHELAHIWLGESALSDITPVATPTHEVETWCNQVAAELLVPLEHLRQELRADEPLELAIRRLARYFKVSTLVILRRVHDAGGLTREQLWTEYRQELDRLREIRTPSGGNFYYTTAARVGRRFASAVIRSTLEGRGSFTEAFRLLGFKKMSTFNELGLTVGAVTE